jgi:aspartate kinase
MIIAKFGGKSVATAKNIRTISEVAKKELPKKPVIVVSALSQVTNMILELADADSSEFNNIFEKIKKTHFDLTNSIWGENTPDEVADYLNQHLERVKLLAKKKNKSKADLDKIVVNGEMMSSCIIANALKLYGINAKQILATDLIVTNDEFGGADFLSKETVKKTKEVINPLLKKGVVPVVTGFMGATKKGEPTTLGRGGSDYSATILGFVLSASEIQIWTDVDGIFSADPGVVRNAKLLKEVTFLEASELAYFGAKVLHPRTMRPARRAGIPMRIINTMNPKGRGTIIDNLSNNRREIKAITSKKRTELINLYSSDMLFSKGFLAKIFSIFAKYNISVDLVGVSEVSVSVTLENHEMLKPALSELSQFTSVAKIPGFGIVSLVGEGIVEIPGIMKKIFSVLDENNIPIKMISLGATDVNISLVVPSEKIETAVEKLHDKILLNI